MGFWSTAWVIDQWVGCPGLFFVGSQKWGLPCNNGVTHPEKTCNCSKLFFTEGFCDSPRAGLVWNFLCLMQEYKAPLSLRKPLQLPPQILFRNRNTKKHEKDTKDSARPCCRFSLWKKWNYYRTCLWNCGCQTVKRRRWKTFRQLNRA